ncbi:MAG TPA: mannosyltransferase family protein [Vicinamibacterales bacterium]|nr:mannosyltransferase family protein [Vicinamibacterales bacterium]
MTSPPSPLPLWARLTDVLVIVIAAAALSVALFGGFRVVLFGAQITAHEPFRPLVVAVVLFAVRHLVHRSPSLGARMRAALRSFVAAESVRAIAPAFVWSRIAVLLVATLSISTFGYSNAVPFRVSKSEMANLPARWDAGWYLGIARTGYEYDRRARRQQNVVFFPAYPLLMRTAGIFFGGHVDDRAAVETRLVNLLWSGVAVNLAALAAALGYLYRMVRAYADRDIAVTAVTLALAYPTAFVYNVPYTEGLFLLGSVATFYHFGRQQFVSAALWGTVVGLSRPNGFILAAPLVMIALARSGPFPGLAPWVDRLNTRSDLPKHLWRDLAVALTPFLGLMMYGGYLYWTWGDPFVWARVQGAWGRSYEGFAPALQSMNSVAEHGVSGYATRSGYEVLNVLPFMLAVGAAIPIAWRLGLAYSTLILLTLMPPLMAGGWLSMARMTITLFPIYIFLALAIPEKHRAGVLVLFALLQGLGASLFFTWRPFY